MTTFQNLGLTPQLLATVEAQGYSQPTPIQAMAIPTILNGNDLFATAPTGTGKTAAFAIPIIQQLEGSSPKQIQTLILAPTRELAHQISDNFKKYAAHTEIKINLIYGGVPQIRQVDRLKRGCQVVIATPGRLLDLMKQGHVKLGNVNTFVLDECDRMLDMGFIDDIKKIREKLDTDNIQTLLFSATASPEIRTLSEEILNQPEKIDILPTELQKPKIEQWLFVISQKNKEELLLQMLEDPEIDSLLVFTRTKLGADKLVKTLRQHKHNCCAIHGDKSQRERTRNLDSFKTGRDRVLVATDVAARGVDIQSLNYVLNFDMAEDAETYTHRIGRTGRAGTEGLAMSFCSPGEHKKLQEVWKAFGEDSLMEMEHEFRIELPQKRSSRNHSGNKDGAERKEGEHKSSRNKRRKPNNKHKSSRVDKKNSGERTENRSNSRKKRRRNASKNRD